MKRTGHGPDSQALARLFPSFCEPQTLSFDSIPRDIVDIINNFLDFKNQLKMKSLNKSYYEEGYFTRRVVEEHSKEYYYCKFSECTGKKDEKESNYILYNALETFISSMSRNKQLLSNNELNLNALERKFIGLETRSKLFSDFISSELSFFHSLDKNKKCIKIGSDENDKMHILFNQIQDSDESGDLLLKALYQFKSIKDLRVEMSGLMGNESVIHKSDIEKKNQILNKILAFGLKAIQKGVYFAPLLIENLIKNHSFKYKYSGFRDASYIIENKTNEVMGALAIASARNKVYVVSDAIFVNNHLAFSHVCKNILTKDFSQINIEFEPNPSIFYLFCEQVFSLNFNNIPSSTIINLLVRAIAMYNASSYETKSHHMPHAKLLLAKCYEKEVGNDPIKKDRTDFAYIDAYKLFEDYMPFTNRFDMDPRILDIRNIKKDNYHFSKNGILIKINENKETKAYFPNGGIYIGELSRDSIEGQGKMYFHNGNVSEGEWKNDRLMKGILHSFLNGTPYECQIIEGKKTGKEIGVNDAGLSCVSEWLDDCLINGYGHVIRGDYELAGIFENGELTGAGQIYKINGEKRTKVLDGIWLNGILVKGKGSIKFDNITIEGKFQNLKLLDNEFIFLGDKFGESIVDGSEAILSFPDGTIVEGCWINGVFSGVGYFTFPNGDKYYGEIANYKPNGKGEITYANGHMYEGTFKDGKPIINN